MFTGIAALCAEENAADRLWAQINSVKRTKFPSARTHAFRGSIFFHRGRIHAASQNIIFNPSRRKLDSSFGSSELPLPSPSTFWR